MVTLPTDFLPLKLGFPIFKNSVADPEPDLFALAEPPPIPLIAVIKWNHKKWDDKFLGNNDASINIKKVI